MLDPCYELTSDSSAGMVPLKKKWLYRMYCLKEYKTSLSLIL